MKDLPNGIRFFSLPSSDRSPLRDARRFSSVPVLYLHSHAALPITADGVLDDSRLSVASGVNDGTFWKPSTMSVNGKTLMCVCPECAAPLSIRAWLLTADCWRCGANVALNEVESAFELDGELEPAAEKRGHTQTTATKTPHSKPAESELAATAGGNIPRPLSEPAIRFRLVNLFDNMPAWLASLMIHLLLLILLALLNLRSLQEDESITLSTSVSRFDQEAVAAKFVDDTDNIDFELPIPESDRPTNRRERDALVVANQRARTLRIDPAEPHPELPDLDQLKRVIGSDVEHRTLAVRDPRIRVDMIRREGGTTLTEAAVARGLQWMATHQNDDGSWSTHAFHQCESCRRRCDGAGSIRSESAGTSLCLLPFLGAGQTHFTGRYKDNVSKGLRWLIDHQRADGDLRFETIGQAGMYAHGQATIVLCEAYALTRDESLRVPAQKAIDFILKAQHPGGGWRYQPGEDGDTSVVGWQIMALQSARAGGLAVPEDSMELAGHFLDTVASEEASRYAYRPRQSPTHVMTAEALLCRMYMGWTMDDPAVGMGLDFLMKTHPPRASQFNIYYWYYATQAMHHAGGRNWREWNRQIRDILVQAQRTSGHTAGSWDPHGPHAAVGGRIYVTALAVCTLEVYYRHAPIFRQLDLY